MTGQQPYRGGFVSAVLARAGLALALSMVVVALSGCHRKTLLPTLPLGSLAPIELETAIDPGSLPLIPSLPLQELGPLPLPPIDAAPVARKRPATREDTPPPVQAAGTPESAALAIGALSIGGDAAPQSQQTARDLIASITKRIAAVPTRTANAQKEQIRQVRHFLDQAQQALASGDADGALNLATKAKLLMDDLEKK